VFSTAYILEGTNKNKAQKRPDRAKNPIIL